MLNRGLATSPEGSATPIRASFCQCLETRRPPASPRRHLVSDVRVDAYPADWRTRRRYAGNPWQTFPSQERFRCLWAATAFQRLPAWCEMARETGRGLSCAIQLYSGTPPPRCVMWLDFAVRRLLLPFNDGKYLICCYLWKVNIPLKSWIVK